VDWIFDRRSGARVSDRLELAGGPVVVLENERLRAVCLAGKGADIVSLFNKDAACECLSQPYPTFPFRPGEAPALGREFGKYMTVWPEMFPVASAWGDYFGQAQPFHGEARLLAWRHEIIEDSPQRVSVRLSARMQLSPFRLTRTMTLDADSPVLALDERVENLANQPLPVLWGHHPTFGPPFLDETCRVQLPGGDYIDGDDSMLQLAPPGSGVHNMFYRLNLSSGRCGLFSHKRGFGVGLRFDHQLFRVIWIWQGLNQNSGAPNFDTRYACAVEPVTGLPKQHAQSDRTPPILVHPETPLTTRLDVFLYTDQRDLED